MLGDSYVGTSSSSRSSNLGLFLILGAFFGPGADAAVWCARAKQPGGGRATSNQTQHNTIERDQEQRGVHAHWVTSWGTCAHEKAPGGRARAPGVQGRGCHAKALPRRLAHATASAVSATTWHNSGSSRGPGGSAAQTRCYLCTHSHVSGTGFVSLLFVSHRVQVCEAKHAKNGNRQNFILHFTCEEVLEWAFFAESRGKDQQELQEDGEAPPRSHHVPQTARHRHRPSLRKVRRKVCHLRLIRPVLAFPALAYAHPHGIAPSVQWA
jgi:hypothetical protein